MGTIFVHHLSVCSQNTGPGYMTLSWLRYMTVMAGTFTGSASLVSLFSQPRPWMYDCHGWAFSLVRHHLSVCSHNPSPGCIALHCHGWAFSLAQTYLSVCDQNPSAGCITLLCCGWAFSLTETYLWLGIFIDSDLPVLRTQAPDVLLCSAVAGHGPAAG